MQHVDPTQCDPRVAQTHLVAAARAALHALVAKARKEARESRAGVVAPWVERRKQPRILGFNGEWTPEQRRAEAHMAANDRRFSGEPITGFGELK